MVAKDKLRTYIEGCILEKAPIYMSYNKIKALADKHIFKVLNVMYEARDVYLEKLIKEDKDEL